MSPEARRSSVTGRDVQKPEVSPKDRSRNVKNKLDQSSRLRFVPAGEAVSYSLSMNQADQGTSERIAVLPPMLESL